MGINRKLWIVDGYNVLRVSLSPSAEASWWTEERRTALTAIASRLPYPDDEIILVFDARHLSEPITSVPEPLDDSPRPLVRHVFAPSADEWIVSRLKHWDNTREPVVVTADRPLRDRARHRGAEIVATDAFLALCGRNA